MRIESSPQRGATREEENPDGDGWSSRRTGQGLQGKGAMAAAGILLLIITLLSLIILVPSVFYFLKQLYVYCLIFFFLLEAYVEIVPFYT